MENGVQHTEPKSVNVVGYFGNHVQLAALIFRRTFDCVTAHWLNSVWFIQFLNLSGRIHWENGNWINLCVFPLSYGFFRRFPKIITNCCSIARSDKYLVFNSNRFFLHSSIYNKIGGFKWNIDNCSIFTICSYSNVSIHLCTIHYVWIMHSTFPTYKQNNKFTLLFTFS